MNKKNIKKPETHAELMELLKSLDFVDHISDIYNDDITAYELNIIIEC